MNYTKCVHGTHGNLKKGWDPLGLQLLSVASCHVELNSGLLEEESVLLLVESFLQPCLLFFEIGS